MLPFLSTQGDELERAILQCVSVQELRSTLLSAGRAILQHHIIQALDQARAVVQEHSLQGALVEAERQLVAARQLYAEVLDRPLLQKQEYLRARACGLLIYTLACLEIDFRLVERVVFATLARAV